jgi:hypothetical protein
MTQYFILKLIAIALLAFIAHDINIATLGLEKARAIKLFANNSIITIQNFYNSIHSPK